MMKKGTNYKEKILQIIFNIKICIFTISYFYLCQFSVHLHTQLGCHRLLHDLPENGLNVISYLQGVGSSIL